MRPLILIANDDGIYAPGIRTLVEIAREFGEVVVCTSDRSYSGKSHSVTFDRPLQIKESSVFADLGIKAYKTTGTPVDSVKLAIYEVIKRKPDLILSGINHGCNSSVNIFYSGTVAVVIEAAMHRIKSAAFSLATHNPNPDFSASEYYIPQIIDFLINYPQNIYLNVNIPNIPLSQIKGIRFARQDSGYWQEKFVPFSHPVRDEKYFWLTGEMKSYEPENIETDKWALDNDYIAIVPLKVDMTDYEILNDIKNVEWASNKKRG